MTRRPAGTPRAIRTARPSPSGGASPPAAKRARGAPADAAVVPSGGGPSGGNSGANADHIESPSSPSRVAMLPDAAPSAQSTAAEAPRARKLTIMPFRKAPRVQVGFAVQAWENFLRPAVRAVHEGQPVPFSLEVLYRKVEDVCLHKFSSDLFERLRSECDAHVGSEVRSLEGLVVEPDAFLRCVDEAWQRHCSQMLRIRAIFLKLDRTYVVACERSDTRSLWDMGLKQLRTHLTRTDSLVEGKTVEALLGLINRERDGETIDHARLRSLLRMFTAVGTYEESFESPLLLATSEYYRAEVTRRLEDWDVPTFLSYAETRLGEEYERASCDLDSGTRKPLMAIAEQRLVADHVEALLKKGFKSMCDERRKGDLNRCYRLFVRVNMYATLDGLEPLEILRAHFTSYVEHVGLEIVTDEAKDSEMVQRLLKLKSEMDAFVSEAFEGSTSFTIACSSAFEKFVNKRESKPAELIAKYLDGVLRTGNKGYSEEELENTLDRALILFRYIDGKDVFEAFYKKDLAKRLLHDKSASHDLEKVMISKLKTECGSQFTSKLESMFRDVDTSKDMIASYRQKRNEGGVPGPSTDMELTVYVLESGRWPLSTQRADIKLPLTLIEHQEAYKRFYQSQREGRKLTWQHFDCSCVVNARFPKGTKILSLSLYQTVVMMLFESRDEVSYKEVAEGTAIEEKELKRTLLSLACGKVRVLQKRPKGPTINDNDVFVFNAAFTHKSRRIKVNAIQMKETVEENTGTREEVFQERGYQIDASIVRIMKTRRQLSHSALIQETFGQLKFPTKSQDVKKRIESLIEREYLARSEENATVYNYLA